MAASTTTKKTLAALVNEVENNTKLLIELLCNPNAKYGDLTPDVLVERLVQTQKEIDKALDNAEIVAEKQKELERIQHEISRKELDILQLQRHLKAAEYVLATALYEARKKLDAVHVAERNPIPSEEIIKYAHKISASYSVGAPPMWEPGDQRRPFPSEIEMRSGLLGKINEVSMNQLIRSSSTASEHGMSLKMGSRIGAKTGKELPKLLGLDRDMALVEDTVHGNHPVADVHMPSLLWSQHSIDANPASANQDIETMSTDSSSSSSSDSQ